MTMGRLVIPLLQVACRAGSTITLVGGEETTNKPKNNRVTTKLRYGHGAAFLGNPGNPPPCTVESATSVVVEVR